MEAVAGILAYIYSEQIGNELKQSLNKTLAEQYSENEGVSSALERLHLEVSFIH